MISVQLTQSKGETLVHKQKMSLNHQTPRRMEKQVGGGHKGARLKGHAGVTMGL